MIFHDPAKVTRLALQNAASVAGLLLTTEVMIAEAPKDEHDHVHPAPGGDSRGFFMKRRPFRRARLSPHLECGVLRRRGEVAVRGEQGKMVPDAQLRDQRVDRAQLDPRAPAAPFHADPESVHDRVESCSPSPGDPCSRSRGNPVHHHVEYAFEGTIPSETACSGTKHPLSRRTRLAYDPTTKTCRAADRTA